MRFIDRHIGPRDSELGAMLREFDSESLEQFIGKVVPEQIALSGDFELSGLETDRSEHEVLRRAAELAAQNTVTRSFYGCGYSDCLMPPVIARNVFENPGWYTQYTPYQAEISQGRLEALLNFQTLISDLTGLPVANSSLLDESTAAAEAITLAFNFISRKRKADSPCKVFVDSEVHPQTAAVLKTRAAGIGIELVFGSLGEMQLEKDFFAVLIQNPATHGEVRDIEPFAKQAKEVGALTIVAADILSLLMLRSPGSLGADIVLGSAQRFGVPLGFGGPHAAFFAVREEYQRLMPGRLIGVSRDSHGAPALRLALQTREQHIRREKATSNICTAQVLLAVISSMYAVYHGPSGLRRIATKVHSLTSSLAKALMNAGCNLRSERFFDTISLKVEDLESIRKRADEAGFLLRFEEGLVTIALDEVSSESDVSELLRIITGKTEEISFETNTQALPSTLLRTDDVLTHPTFHRYQSETEFLRYAKRLENKDLSLCHSMIPLGSCTMKLNATAEMIPVSYEGFSALHPFAPLEHSKGYQVLFEELRTALAEMTGFDAVSVQPNAGSQGEYAGLLSIRRYLDANGGQERDICLIPVSAHGTNPASAVMAGMKVQIIACDSEGNIDLEDLRSKIDTHRDKLAALMITYPSTHGVFEEAVGEVCGLVHEAGGQVYLDGANLNALVGIAKPADFGADVLHFNLHKTFCIPHGGGGPGMGPIAARAHLAPYLPGHPVVEPQAGLTEGAVSAAPWGSASILPISWTYMQMMGADGLKRASQVAILNANYIAKRLSGSYDILYTGKSGLIAHECIIDVRPFKSAGIEVDDIAKRLIDYGFHAPTMSWPVVGTLMIEPTESESKEELDRFCDAMLSIREEIAKVESGAYDAADNPLKNAPHTLDHVSADTWSHPYSREEAAFPKPWIRERKFWSTVGRVDSAYGDRNLVCSCPSVEDYAEVA